ncbi:MAG: HNH endonuclease, partial [Ruminococcus sp.]
MLNNFYQSKPWVKLMAVIRMERTNAEGQIICEHCGKPIVHKYDCIGHHIIELNEANVNDAN